MSTTGTDPPAHYHVADLLLDDGARRVTRDGREIELSALNFDLLRHLVVSAPRVVTYDELAEKVWGRHFVSPENVSQRVKLLRKDLGDDASEPRYIETVRSKGYRLIPERAVVVDSERAGRPRSPRRRIRVGRRGRGARRRAHRRLFVCDPVGEHEPPSAAERRLAPCSRNRGCAESDRRHSRHDVGAGCRSLRTGADAGGPGRNPAARPGAWFR